MHALNELLNLCLVVAVFLYFAGFVVPSPLRWRLWRWAAGLVGFVFGAALLVVETRAHPFTALCILCGTSAVSYVILQIRRGHRERAHRRPAPTPFLNLRVTGKTAVDPEDEQPLGENEEHE